MLLAKQYVDVGEDHDCQINDVSSQFLGLD